MNKFFISNTLGYYETTDDIPTPPNTISVTQRPSSEYSWVNNGWVKTVLTPEQEMAKLEEKRAAAHLSRKQFCLNVKYAGVLTGADSVIAAKGWLPPVFQNMLTEAGIDADDAAIIWATTDEVWRNDPLITVLANRMGVELADTLFGITGV